MADWDDEEWDVPDLNKPAGNEPPSTWSDEEEEEAPAPAPAAPAPRAPPKEKTGLAAKIEEREEREAEEARQKAALRAELNVGNLEAIEGLEGEALEKARQQKLQEAADLDNAIDAFGLMQPNKPRPTEAPMKEGEIEAFEPKTDKEFEALAGLIDKKLKTFEGQPGHLLCIKELLRKATAGITTDEAKDLSTFVSVLYNDKVKADRDKDKKGKKTKAKGKVSVNAGKAQDMDDWGGGDGRLRDDDYDFM